MSPLFLASYLLLWVIVLFLGLAFLEALRQIGLLRRQVGPQQGAAILTGSVPTGEPLPELTGHRARDGSLAKWGQILKNDLAVAVFLTPHCITCREIAEELDGLIRDIPRKVSLVVFIEGPPDEVETFCRETGIDREIVVIDHEGRTKKELGIGWNPAALTIEHGIVGVAGIVNTVYQIDALVREELLKAPARPTEHLAGAAF